MRYTINCILHSLFVSFYEGLSVDEQAQVEYQIQQLTISDETLRSLHVLVEIDHEIYCLFAELNICVIGFFRTKNEFHLTSGFRLQVDPTQIKQDPAILHLIEQAKVVRRTLLTD